MSIVAESVKSSKNVSRGTFVKSEQQDTGVSFNVSGNLFIVRPFVSVPPCCNLSERTEITKFSETSGARMRKYLRECIADYRYMLTLTYPCGYETDGRNSKEHLRRFLQQARRFLFGRETADPSWGFFWFMEFQERGAIHYHIFSTHRYPKEWVSATWYDIVASEDVRHLNAGTRIETLRSGRGGTISYASKYAAKQSQKVIPAQIQNAGRFWGVCGVRGCMSAATAVPDDVATNPLVRRRVIHLKELLNTALINKNAVKMETKHGDGTIYVINCVRTLESMRFAVWFVQNAVILAGSKASKRSYFNWPEFNDDLSCQ